MANQFQGITSGLAELKNYYEGPIQDQFNEDLPILRAAEKIKKGWSGYQVVRPLRVRRNQGIGATSDGGSLPSIGRQATTQATFQSAFNYLRFGITGPMIKASQSDTGSFVRSASYELEMGYKDLKSDVNRQLSWDGTGTLALVNANTNASTTLVVASRSGSEPALKFLDVGLVFDIVSGSTVTNSGVTILSIATTSTPQSTTATLTLSQPVTCLALDKVVRANASGQEISGIFYSMDGGTSSVYGVDRSTYPAYQGNVISRNSQQLTLDYLQTLYNEALRRGNAKLTAHYTDFDSIRFYQKLLTADKRYSNTVKGDGGFAEKDKFYLEFNGLPIVPDKDCPPRWAMLATEAWKMYVLCELEFADETGSMYIAQSGADTLEVRLRYFSQLFNEQPNANAVGTNYVSP
jgi:hypothetical protein